jgi:hypothetical protein
LAAGCFERNAYHVISETAHERTAPVSRNGKLDFGLIRVDIKENRHITNFLQRPSIGLRGSIRIAGECVENDSATIKAVSTDALDGQ